MHHRRFDFNVSAAVKELPELADDPRACLKNPPRLFRGHQVQIPLSVTQFNVSQAMPLFRQRKQGFRQKEELFHPNRQFARLRPKEVPAHPDMVAQVQQVKKLKTPLPDHVLLYINLNTLARPLQMGKTGLAHQSIGNDAPGYPHFFLFGFQFGPARFGVLAHKILWAIGPPEFAWKCFIAKSLYLL